LVANRPGLPAWITRRASQDRFVSTVYVMTATTEVRVRRVYGSPEAADGRRVLVDRLWPRGVAKTAIDEWAKAAAPSTELREWYGHETAKFPAFRERYLAELQSPEWAEAVAHLRDLARSGPVTLLTATKDVEHSQAVVLAEFLRRTA
jgi:uncharacterized protein YeaO (DUF488 family)